MQVRLLCLLCACLQCVLAKSEDGQYLVKRVGENYTQTEWMDFPIDSKGVCHDPALALAIQAFRSGEEAFHKARILRSGRDLPHALPALLCTLLCPGSGVVPYCL